ncbi:unnamed protein product [Rhizopus stolonifer]
MVYGHTLTDLNKIIAINKLETCEMVPCFPYGGDLRIPFVYQPYLRAAESSKETSCDEEVAPVEEIENEPTIAAKKNCKNL